MNYSHHLPSNMYYNLSGASNTYYKTILQFISNKIDCVMSLCMQDMLILGRPSAKSNLPLTHHLQKIYG